LIREERVGASTDGMFEINVYAFLRQLDNLSFLIKIKKNILNFTIKIKDSITINLFYTKPYQSKKEKKNMYDDIPCFSPGCKGRKFILLRALIWFGMVVRFTLDWSPSRYVFLIRKSYIKIDDLYA